MNRSKITSRIFGFAHSIVGFLPGGLGYANVVASLIFAGMSGAAVVDAAGLGQIELEAMQDGGYDKGFSVAITAASSTIGPIFPPSLPMVVFSYMSGVSIGRLFLGGVVPGIMMTAILMGMVSLFAHKRGYPRLPVPTFMGLPKSFADAVLPLMTPVILLGGIWTGIFTPTEAAGVAVFSSLMILPPILMPAIRPCGEDHRTVPATAVHRADSDRAVSRAGRSVVGLHVHVAALNGRRSQDTMADTKLGFGFYHHMLNDQRYQFARQCGATHAVVHLVDYSQNGAKEGENHPDNQPVGGSEGRGRAGATRDPLDCYDVILGGPDRDWQLERIKQIIRDVGRAGIPVIGYNFSIAGVVGRIKGPFARGGEDGDGTNVPEASEADLWARLEYFLRAALPVAEAAGVRLAAHSDDPPFATLRRQPRLVYRHDRYQRLLDLVPSRANALEMCLGTLQEMQDGGIYRSIERHVAARQVGYIHLRNVVGKIPAYQRGISGRRRSGRRTGNAAAGETRLRRRGVPRPHKAANHGTFHSGLNQAWVWSGASRTSVSIA